MLEHPFYQAVISYGMNWRNKAGWQIEIKIGNFDSILGAAVFGRDAGWILHPLNANYLLLLAGSGEVLTIGLEDVIINELKPESIGKLMTDGNDYQTVTITEEEFLTLPEDFYSLSHGVIDNLGEKVPLKKWKNAVTEIDKAPIPSTNFPLFGYSSLSSIERVYGSLTPSELEKMGKQIKAGTATKFIFNPAALISPEINEILEEGDRRFFGETKL